MQYMEATREFYWNVGHGVFGPMYLMAAGAIALCLWGFYRRLPTYRLGQTLERSALALATGAPLLVSNCPFCLTMFEDGIKTGGFEGKIQARDLAEIVAQRIAVQP